MSQDDIGHQDRPEDRVRLGNSGSGRGVPALIAVVAALLVIGYFAFSGSGNQDAPTAPPATATN